MTTATLTFTLPDDREDFELACNARKYLVGLESVAQAFRDKAKYAEDKIDWEDAKALFWETLGDAGVELP